MYKLFLRCDVFKKNYGIFKNSILKIFAEFLILLEISYVLLHLEYEKQVFEYVQHGTMIRCDNYQHVV